MQDTYIGIILQFTDGAEQMWGGWASNSASHHLCPHPLKLKTEHFVNSVYSNFRNYAPPLDEKGGIITEKVVPVFSKSFFGACFAM